MIYKPLIVKRYMKLHLPLNLLAALMTSFSGVTLGTATFAGVSGLLITVSQAYAADVAFNGTQVNVAAGVLPPMKWALSRLPPP